MAKLAVIILAAGQGKRMRSELPKVLHPVLGRPLVDYSVDLALGLGAERVAVVVGVGAEKVKRHLEQRRTSKLRFALQRKQRGTGHATNAAAPALKGFHGDVLILYGDVPLLTSATIQRLRSAHQKQRAKLSLVTVRLDQPRGYGRILRDQAGQVIGIVEEGDCTPAQRAITESNPGIYLCDAGLLFRLLPLLRADNRQKEYYLTDLVGVVVAEGLRIASIEAHDPQEVFGVNSRGQLQEAEAALRARVNAALMEGGVTLEDPERTWIAPSVKIGTDTVIESGVRVLGQSRIGKGCVIEQGARLLDSVLGNGVRVLAGSVLEQSTVGERSQIGPMAHLRPGSAVGREARIGAFVQLKNAAIGDGTKAVHLTYLGDAKIGKNVNVGCGTITCNYDGIKKSMTIIEDDAFIGSDTQLIAPVKVGKGAFVGSGSTITQDVEPGALALSRAPEVHKPGWVKARAARLKKEAKDGKRRN